MAAQNIRIAVEEASNVVQAALERAGLCAGDATIIRAALIEAELTGRKGHGIARVPGIVARARGHGSDKIRVVRDLGSAVSLDGGGALGYLAAFRAANLAIERLANQPTIAVGCRRTSHAGAIGYYARLVAERGHFAMTMADCSPFLAPYGARYAVFGTNPLAFACPGPSHPLVADLSPGATTYGAMLNARHASAALPEGVAIDAEGRPTTSVEAAMDGAILPVAGPKGSALAFMVQAMTGALCGATSVPEPGINYGFFLFAARNDVFVPTEAVEERIAQLAGAVHRAGARCPGDRSEEHRRACTAGGIEVSEGLWRQVMAFTAQCP